MSALNPNMLVFVGFCTVVGYLLGSWAVGLAVGLAVVLLGTADAMRRRR